MSSTADKVSQARADLENAVLALRDSDAWKRQMAILARFHHYSWQNQLLIACQCPDASYVKGFKSWLPLGRAVHKGERGIRIFAPRPWQRLKADETGEEQAESGISFAVVHVFDVSQTDPIPGHANPWHPPVHLSAAGDDECAALLWSALADHAAALGLTLSTAESDPLASAHTYGYYWHERRAIWVRPGRSRPDMTATLAHELAHALTHAATCSMSRGGREVVAESIAYAVCSLSGLEMELRSVDYVAGWLDDPDAFKAGMAAIHQGAASLIRAIEPALLVADAELPLAA